MSQRKSYPISSLEIPSLLTEITDPPKQLYIRGVYTEGDVYFLTIVGSRKYTSYGKDACESIISGLQGYPIVIISGLALGIDGIAHKSALRAGLQTIAVPGSGLDDNVLYPATHKQLAHDILDSGGALISEFEPKWRPRPESFPQRNRIMAGMSHAVLIIEAQLRSGTLITSRLATEYNRDVLAVPGPITGINSAGPNMLIQKGAGLVQSSEDILSALGLDKKTSKQKTLPLELSVEEQKIYEILHKPLSRDDLVRKLALPISKTNILLSSLELKGHIKETLGKIERVV